MSDDEKSGFFSKMLDNQVSKNNEDIYDIKNFGDVKKESRLQAKIKRIKATFTGSGGIASKFFSGMVMGATVGGVAGLVFGFGAYLQYRRLIYIPVVACSMAFSFGFFMGVGTVVRTDDGFVLLNTVKIENGELVIGQPEWKTRYQVDS